MESMHNSPFTLYYWLIECVNSESICKEKPYKKLNERGI